MNTETPKIEVPTTGRIVHFFQPYKLLLPVPMAAIVTDGGDLAPCLTVFPKGEYPMAVFSIQHKSSAPAGQPYWDWPKLEQPVVETAPQPTEPTTPRVIFVPTGKSGKLGDIYDISDELGEKIEAEINSYKKTGKDKSIPAVLHHISTNIPLTATQLVGISVVLELGRRPKSDFDMLMSLIGR